MSSVCSGLRVSEVRIGGSVIKRSRAEVYFEHDPQMCVHPASGAILRRRPFWVSYGGLRRAS